jgi:acetyl esterase/lipase
MLKNAHFSNIDPEFAAVKAECDANFGALFSLPLSELKAVSATAPPSLGPYVSKDLDIHHQNVPVRDGTDIDVRIYKAKNVQEKASLFLVSHGGGWVIGSHGIDEAVSRVVADKTNTVVVSVDYRMYLTFRNLCGP